MSSYDHISVIKLASRTSSRPTTQTLDTTQAIGSSITADLDQAATILKAKHELKSCDAHPHCDSCEDAGEYRHCKLDFRIDDNTNLLFISFKHCLVENSGAQINTLQVFAPVNQVTDLVDLIKLLKFPRYALENIPIEILSGITQVLAFQESLKSIEFKRVDLTMSTIEFLRNILIGSTSLEQLHFVGCNWPPTPDDGVFAAHPESVAMLNEGFRATRSLKQARLVDCSFVDGDMANLIRDLTPNLEKLNLRGNLCGIETYEVLGALLKREDCKLEDLNLNNQSADPAPVSALALASTHNTSLKKLDFSWNRLEDAGVTCLVQLLQENSTLETLRLGSPPPEDWEESDDEGDDLRNNCMTQTGFQLLGQGLAKFKGLRTLDLSWSRLLPESLESFVKGLEQNLVLTAISGIDETDDKQLWGTLDYLLRLNKAGRRALHTSLKRSLWPLVLARSNQDPDGLHHFLKEEVLWVSFDELSSRKRRRH